MGSRLFLLPVLGWTFLNSLGLQVSMSAGPPNSEEVFKKLRDEMVQRQLTDRGIRDERVLKAMKKVPRHVFVPESLQGQAYEDGPLPIGHRQTISQPYIVAFMTEALQVEPADRVLEIGTGSGYQAAVLAELAREVYSVEILEPLYESAKKRLQALGYRHIYLKLGDGWAGWPENAPFDKIIVTAAADKIPEGLVDQLREGGRMIIPVGPHAENQELVVGVKEKGTFRSSETLPVRFVPLIRNPSRDPSKEGKE